ncbi:hypothetical protein [Campylobacter lari]|uniref:hypothetical protein n=1 Tax=Campylobacter lari TaxID=201 RepID=UPI002153480E|nr:hypothetical protein [Campylobacter lari]MCR6543201.1 hypothetical protein [Campylobacter lari]
MTHLLLASSNNIEENLKIERGEFVNLQQIISTHRLLDYKIVLRLSKSKAHIADKIVGIVNSGSTGVPVFPFRGGKLDAEFSKKNNFEFEMYLAEGYDPRSISNSWFDIAKVKSV